MQNNSVRNYRAGQPDLFSIENKTSNVEVNRKRDAYGSNVYGVPVHAYNEAQGNNGIQSYVPDEIIDPKFSRLNQGNQEKDHSHEQDMEIGYEESPPQPTYEGLEQRFAAEIMKLSREQRDAEDTEFARHMERMLDINREYQEKLSSLRAQQTTRREEFLHKELQSRLNQYQESKRNHRPYMKVTDADSYIPASTFTAGEATSRFHDATEYKRSGECSISSGRSKGSEARVPLPPGRVYNNKTVYH